MADLTASDVTFTIRKRDKLQNRYVVYAKLAFGDSSKTYPSGGVPITSEKFGFVRPLSLEVVESDGNVLMYRYDLGSETLRIFYPTDEQLFDRNRAAVEMGNTVAPAAAALEVVAMGFDTHN